MQIPGENAKKVGGTRLLLYRMKFVSSSSPSKFSLRKMQPVSHIYTNFPQQQLTFDISCVAPSGDICMNSFLCTMQIGKTISLRIKYAVGCSSVVSESVQSKDYLMLIEQNLSENSLFRFHFQAVISHEKDEVVREKLSFTEPSAHSGKHPNLVTLHSTGYSYSILTYQSYNISNCWMETLFMERKNQF